MVAWYLSHMDFGIDALVAYHRREEEPRIVQFLVEDQ